LNTWGLFGSKQGRGEEGRNFNYMHVFVQKRGGEVRDVYNIYVWYTREGFYN
jgi:hypothetical protein